MDKNTKIRLKTGAIYTIEELGIKYEMDEARTIQVVNAMIKKGAATILQTKTKEEELFQKIMEEENITNAADALEQDKENKLDNIAETKRAGQFVHETVELDYPNYTMAKTAKIEIARDFRIRDSQIIDTDNCCTLILHNVSEEEFVAICKRYRLKNTIDKVTNTADNAVDKLTKGVDYTAKNIATPVVGIATKGAISVFKSLASVVAKTGAVAISAGTKGVKDTINEIGSDPDIIVAKSELIKTKDSISRKISGMGGSTGSGIRVK